MTAPTTHNTTPDTSRKGWVELDGNAVLQLLRTGTLPTGSGKPVTRQGGREA